MIYPLPPLCLLLVQAQTVKNNASSRKKVYAGKDLKIASLIGSKVTATLPVGWILSIGGVALGRVCDIQGYLI